MGFGDDRPLVDVSSEEGRKTIEFCVMGQAWSVDVTGAVNLMHQAEDGIGHLLGKG